MGRFTAFRTMVVVLAVILTGFAFIGAYLTYAHIQQDHQDHHALVQILIYNLQKGHLEAIPAPVVPASSTPAPEKK